MSDIGGGAGVEDVVGAGDVDATGDFAAASGIEEVCQVDDGVDPVVVEEVGERVSYVLMDEGDVAGVVDFRGSDVRGEDELDVFGGLESGESACCRCIRMRR